MARQGSSKQPRETTRASGASLWCSVPEPRTLPAKLRAQRDRALSNSYVMGFDILRPTRESDWKWGWHCLEGAVKASPSNTPHVLARIVGQMVRSAGSRTARQEARSVWGSAFRQFAPARIAPRSAG